MRIIFLLAVVVLVLSGCVTPPIKVDWQQQTKYRKVAVVSTLGQEVSIINQRFVIGDAILETKRLPYEAVVEPIEKLVIEWVEARDLHADGISREMEDFDFINNIFPGEPMLRTGKIKDELRKRGYDLAVVILPSTFLRGDHNTYLYDQMGVYRWHLFSKPKEQAFVNFYLYFIDLVGDDDLGGGGGLWRVPSDVSIEPVVKEEARLTEQQWNAIQKQVRDLALQRISEILNERFGPL